MAPIRHHTLRGTCSMVHRMVRLRLSRNSSGFRKGIRMDEYYWSHDTALISLLPAMVRKHVWSGASELLDQGLSGRAGTHR